jgi:hypothetical protein
MLFNLNQHSCAFMTRSDGHRRFSVLWLLAWFPVSLSSMALLSGCASSVPTKAGVISVTYPSGATPGQLPVLSTAKVSMMPANDVANSGVDWTLTCGGNAQAGYTTTGCGTLVPSHTADGSAATYSAPGVIPVNVAVTITARVTSDPSQQSSITITIVNPVISVAMSAVPPTLAVGGTTKVSATITNDVNTLGVNWSAALTSSPNTPCAMSVCGSFNPIQTRSMVSTAYTAPATSPAGGITITATSVGDSTKSASATITILPITVSVSPSAFNISTSGTESLTAVVANDVNSAGVGWTATCGSTAAGACGTFSPTKTASGIATTYTAPSSIPSGGPVTITATSANDGMTSASAAATVTASPVITVNITQAPATLSVGKGATFNATVTGDSSNAGVDWTATCGSAVAGACGVFNPATTASAIGTVYTAPSTLPANNPVTVIATSHAFNLNHSLLANSATAAVTISAPAAITFTQQPPGSLTANGTATVSAYVSNDATEGGGVTWTVQCSSTTDGACGYIKPYKTANGAQATYVAPPVSPGVPVYIKAASTAIASTTVLSTPITINASNTHSIAFVPFAPSQLQLGTTVSLNAAVTNDSSNSGVDWAVCASGCGFFTIKPAIPEIKAVAPSPGNPGSPYVPAVPAVTATSASGWPNGLPISYTAPTAAPEDGTILVSAAATADRLNDVSQPATAVSTITLTAAPAGPELHGSVQAGTLPVVGASVYLYAAGVSGYASASSPVYNPSTAAFATTDSSGSFTLPAGYTCPALTSQVYLVALGGQVGASGVNPSLGLMTALGPCSNLSSTPVIINEITTVASAVALTPFSADNVQTGELSYLYIGSSSANATAGLANAFASVNNLVDITTGQPKFWTVAGNAVVPYVEINTLADALNACVATAGGSAGDGSACGNLFLYTNPLSSYASYAPTDTLQAIFDLLKPPPATITYQVAHSSVFGLASLSSPYQPILSSALAQNDPQGWAISLNYTSGGGVGGSGSTASGSSALAIDASGNVWIANKSINSVSEWNSLGASYSAGTIGSAAGGFSGGGIYAPTAIGVDPDGYVWVVNGNGTLSKLDFTGTADSNSPFSGGGLSTGSGMAIDGSGNVWVTSSGAPGSVAEFNNRGIPLSPTAGFTAGIDDPGTIAIDGSGNVWVAVSGTSPFVKLDGGNGTLMLGVYEGNTGNPVPPQLAIDKAGDLWNAFGELDIQEIPIGYTGLHAGAQLVIYANSAINQIGNPQGMALDGSNRLWMANAGYNPDPTHNTPANLSLFDRTQVNGGISIFYADPALSNGPSSVAVDSAGNVWVLLNNNTVKEFVGVATPVITPLSVGVKENKLGTKP